MIIKSIKKYLSRPKTWLLILFAMVLPIIGFTISTWQWWLLTIMFITYGELDDN